MNKNISELPHNKIEIIQFLILFIISIIFVYYLPSFMNKLFFLLLLLIAWFSKKDYFWLTFFIIVISCPMRLFEDYGGQVIHRIPQFDFIGEYGLTFNELFLILFFIKAKFKGIKNDLIMKQKYYLLLVLIILLWLLSFIYGIETSNFISYMRGMLYFTLFYSIPRLIKNKDIIFIFRIFIVFTILSLINQILSATIGFNVADKIAGKHWVEIFFIDVKYIRVPDSILSQFFVFIFSLSYYTMKTPPVKKRFLLILVVLSYISIFMSGSRGWVLAFSFVILFYITFVEKQKTNLIISSIFAIIILFLFISFIPAVQQLFVSNIERLATMQQLAEGDASAGGTLMRLTERLPRLMEGVKQNPVLGWGFSQKFAFYRDQHVGWANQVLQIGLLGLFIFIYFWLSFWRYNANLSKKLSSFNPYKRSLLVLNLGLLCMLIIHSTSRTMFNITMHRSILVLVILYFIISDIWAKLAIENEIFIRKNNNL